MKKVSIQDLKAQLSALIAEAESGRTVLITRHNEPVARLEPMRPAHLHPASSRQLTPLKPAIRGGTSGRALELLLEDRGHR